MKASKKNATKLAIFKPVSYNKKKISAQIAGVCSILLLQSCIGITHKGNGYEYVPVEISKRITARKRCSCIVYSGIDGYHYKPTIIKKVAGNYKSEKLPLIEKKHFITQTLSFDCNLISFSVSNLTSARTDIYVYDIRKQKLQNVTKSENSSSGSSAFSPVNYQLAYLSNNKIHIYDLQSKILTKINTPDQIIIKFITWSSNGKYIFVEDENTNIWRYDYKIKSLKLIWQTGNSMQSSRFLTPSENNDEMFYFISDHESDFKQVYKYDNGKVTKIINSTYDKLLLQRPIIDGYIYYRSNENGEYKLKRYKDGINETILDHGVLYDYFPVFENSGIATYADQYNSPSIFEIKKNFTKNLLNLARPDTSQSPRYAINKNGAFNLIYFPPTKPKGWVVWLHGGPKEQFSNRYMIYIASMVKAGYAVIALNYPGSIGFGNKYELIQSPKDSIINKQIEGVREDLMQICKTYKISTYSIVALSYSTLIARSYILRYQNEVSHYVDLCGVNGSSTPYKIPVLYIYGENDPAIKDFNRIEMINQQVKNHKATILSLKNDNHNILNRENIFLTINKINEFLNNK